jgi:hypothetical protein
MLNLTNLRIKSSAVIALYGVLLLALIEIFAGCITANPQPQVTPVVHDGYPGPGTPFSVPSSIPETMMRPEGQQILEYQEMLRNDNLSEDMRRALQTKIEILSREATQIAISTPPQISLESIPATLTSIPRRRFPTPTSPVGLREGGTDTFRSWEADIKNIWSQYLNEYEYIIVYAGELGFEMEYPGRGVVFVNRRFAGRGSSFNRYLLPEGTGWVRISEVRGDYLVLTSEEGATFYFYIPAQQFVSSLRDTPPTVTPLPTRIPDPTPYP